MLFFCFVDQLNKETHENWCSTDIDEATVAYIVTLNLYVLCNTFCSFLGITYLYINIQ